MILGFVILFPISTIWSVINKTDAESTVVFVVSEINSVAPLEKFAEKRSEKNMKIAWHVRMSDHIPR